MTNRLKIDAHTHILPPQLPRWADKFGYAGFIHLEHDETARTADMMRGDTFFRRIKSNCWDAQERIEEYANHQTKVQVVCTIPVLFSYWAKPQDGAEIATFLNDHIAQLVYDFPQHYIGLATLPMQDTNLAIKELERCKQIGMAGIQIGSNINDINLDDARFFPIFEACQQLDMAVMVHPWNMMGQAHIQKYWLPWLVGMPAETTRAICSLLFGGVFERLPDVRFCFAHAGGSFVFTIGRIEHGFNCRPDLVAIDNQINPRNYLGKFWVDSITHDATALQFIINAIGVDKVMFGTDYPFPLGDLEMGVFMENMNLAEADLDAIFHKNVKHWLYGN
ncbi:MAG: amidohydrolase [Saprospiraceae bacterium]|nr:amidohydrolase [Saprospiraceae bacterium]MBP7680062.1 amidohydrolase [Saprospiraceae bacterium]